MMISTVLMATTRCGATRSSCPSCCRVRRETSWPQWPWHVCASTAAQSAQCARWAMSCWANSSTQWPSGMCVIWLTSQCFLNSSTQCPSGKCVISQWAYVTHLPWSHIALIITGTKATLKLFWLKFIFDPWATPNNGFSVVKIPFPLSFKFLLLHYAATFFTATHAPNFAF